MMTAEDVIAGRIEYYIETAHDEVAENMQGFALELLATTMLSLDKVQDAIDATWDETDDGQDMMADAITAMVFALVGRLKIKLDLDLEDET